MNFGRLSGAIVDVCRGHGTFLDRGELHDVVRFILEGGLDRMRQAERDELKEEQRRLRESQFQQARMAPAGPTPAWSHSSLHMFLTALLGRE
jgi:Zn-finger nucleic acid-binding protein